MTLCILSQLKHNTDNSATICYSNYVPTAKYLCYLLNLNLVLTTKQTLIFVVIVVLFEQIKLDFTFQILFESQPYKNRRFLYTDKLKQRIQGHRIGKFYKKKSTAITKEFYVFISTTNNLLNYMLLRKLIQI